MTIERDDEALPSIVCDRCGVRVVLDIDPEAGDREIAEAVADLGWRRDKPEKQAFPTAFARNVVVYEQDFCGDCQSDEPAPKPLVRPRPARPHRLGDAFANDPCDEWPRPLIFAAVGLRPDCGHPPGGPSECDYCRRGFPAGDTRPAWRRS